MSYKTQVRIYFQDTDAGGIVYHSNYLVYAERARSDFLRDIGLSNSVLIDKGIGFVIRRAEIGYHAPAKLDDLLDVETKIVEIKNVSMTMKQSILKAGKVLVDITVQVAFVSPKTLTLIRLPVEMKELFLKYIVEGEKNAD